MKLSTSQRSLYLLSAVLLALTLVIVVVWGLWRTPNEATDGAAVIPETIVEPGDSTSMPPLEYEEAEGVNGVAEGTVRTVVYYQDNYGYLVPVTRTIPQEEGIAKATLNLMVQSAYNDMEAARLGLRTVLPEGTTIDLDVLKDGTARVNLGEQVLKMADAEAEANMVSAVVQTLTEFPTVSQVEFQVGGQKKSALPFGTSIDKPFARGAVNLESTDLALDPAAMRTVQLYFPGDASSLIVPVTRMVYGSSDINTAVLELAKGPSAQSPLENALPTGCGLISVNVKEGVATLNFTKEFMNIAEESDGGRVALRALMLTCTRFEGIKRVEIQVEGKAYDPGASTLALPTFVNDAASLTQEYIRTQTAAIFEMD